MKTSGLVANLRIGKLANHHPSLCDFRGPNKNVPSVPASLVENPTPRFDAEGTRCWFRDQHLKTDRDYRRRGPARGLCVDSPVGKQDDARAVNRSTTRSAGPGSTRSGGSWLNSNSSSSCGVNSDSSGRSSSSFSSAFSGPCALRWRFHSGSQALRDFKVRSIMLSWCGEVSMPQWSRRFTADSD